MENTLAFARQMDEADELKIFRRRFYIPQKDGKELIYFAGNSLGLENTDVSYSVDAEMVKWERLGVEGHFAEEKPWFDFHKLLKKPLAHFTGAKENEVTAMNSLTVNLHLLMISFYQPKGKRNKILVENRAFSSDQYAIESQARLQRLDPNEVIVELNPRVGEYTLRTDDIISKIKELGDELALILLGGVNYYTGQAFEMHKITEAGHQVGALVAFDLAHAIGNIPLQLHNWEVDFAVWCSYKYLNSGPGSVGGAFVHEKHHFNTDLQRLAGWWGYEESSRFQMEKGFKPQQNIDAWQISNVPVFSLAAHKAAVDIFEEAGGMSVLRAKSEKLTAFLELLIQEISKELNFLISIITPSDKNQRGCQLSLIIKKGGRAIYAFLSEQGVICDWREPDVLRIAPVPLYNSFEEVYRFGEILREAIKSM